LRSLITVAQSEIIQTNRRGTPGIYDISYSSNCDAGDGRGRDVKTAASNKDVIFWSGHGGPGGWGWVLDDFIGACGSNNLYIGGSADPFIIPINFGGKSPVVFTGSCLTGNYEVERGCSIAKAFLRHGAAVYVGATEVSPISIDPVCWDRFFRIWPYSRGYPFSVGEGIRIIKDWALKYQGNWGQYWSLEYNLYGDPKFTLPYFSSKCISDDDSIITTNYYAEVPPSTLEIEVPDYEVNTIGRFDYVEIPGGDILLEEDGRPRVPYYITSVDFPSDYRIQDVSLKERSGLMTASDLELPVVSQTADILVPMEMEEGWYPEIDYTWRVLENDNGTTTLVVSIYPFYYNSDTFQIKFYKNYKFDIEYIQSDISISALYTDKECYNPGDEVIIHMWLNNPGEMRDIVTSLAVKKYGPIDYVDGLSLRTLKNVNGVSSSTVIWETIGVEKGSYYLEAVISDNYGNILDRKILDLCLSFGDVTVELVTGGFGVSADVRNNGTENETDIHWSTSVDGKIVIFDGYKEGIIPVLLADESSKVKSGFIFGFGDAMITVYAGGSLKELSCFLIGPFVISLKEF